MKQLEEMVDSAVQAGVKDFIIKNITHDNISYVNLGKLHSIQQLLEKGPPLGKRPLSTVSTFRVPS